MKFDLIKMMETDSLKNSSQMLFVTTDDWNAVQGTMQLYDRDTNGKWSAVSKVFPIVVGRNGLAWGRGLHNPTGDNTLQKKEGDGKSPAGIFVVGEAFGFASKEEADWIKFPYVHISEKLECVDDINSQYYNQLIAREPETNVDWNSSEKMRAVGEEYRWGIVVKHNMSPVENGCGSCIFLHIWKSAESGTSGCTAMESTNIEMLLRWLDPNKNPVLVQLPTGELDKLKIGDVNSLIQ